MAELNDLVLFEDLDDERVRSLALEVAALTRRHTASRAHGSGRKFDRPGTESWGDYRRRSPFAGTANPRSPGLRMRIDAEAAIPTAHGELTVPAAFAGPPALVHGGIIAGLLDEAIGWLAAATVPDAAVVTGKLAVRFHAPTPVDAPLYLQVAVTKRTTRSMTVEAALSIRGPIGDIGPASVRPTATGEALMVVRR